MDDIGQRFAGHMEDNKVPMRGLALQTHRAPCWSVERTQVLSAAGSA